MSSPDAPGDPPTGPTRLEDPSESFVLLPGDGPLVVSIPHAGTGLPAAVAARLHPDARALPDTDWGVPELYDFVRADGGGFVDATLIRSRASRYLVDLNRDPSGASLYPGRATTGLVPLERFDGAPVWLAGSEPDSDEVEARRRRWFEPYHEALRRALSSARARHGFAVLWDAHSIRSRVPRLFDGRLPDLNLGTHHGASCHPAVQSAAEKAMRAGERTRVVNGRFTGGWITRHHGRPDEDVHALQMEIALAAYMDERPPWRVDEARARPLREQLMGIMNAVVTAAARLPASNRYQEASG